MRQAMVWMVVISMVVVFSGGVSAQQKGPVEAVAQGLVDSVVKGCDKELKMYCKDVTPGEGRGLACLYAYSDKLSAKCEYALYDAAAQLERAINALSYAVNECREDLTKYCADIKPGEGRLLKCIEKNDAKVTPRCKSAMKDVGLKK
jgi:hypothetical protein